MKGDRIRRENELREKISREAYVETPGNKPVTDGPIDPERFNTTNGSRVVFFTREPYGDTGGWDLPKALRRMTSLEEQPSKGKPTFKAQVETVTRLNDSMCDSNSVKAYEIYKGNTAVVNVKKEPNTQSSKSNPNSIRKHAAENKEILQAQYDNCELGANDYVILAGTEKYLAEDNGDCVKIFGRLFNKSNKETTKVGAKQIEFTKYTNEDGGPTIISTPHPAADRYIKGGYADNVKKVVDSSETKTNSNNKIKDEQDAKSLAAKIIDAGASICKDTLNYIKENPKTTSVIVLGVVVITTSGCLVYKKIKNKKNKNNH